MTLNETRKLSSHICRLLKVHDITWTIARTPKGNIGLMFNVDNNEFEVMLDSVPLSTGNPLQDENNIELKAMIEKYYFESDTPTLSFTPSAPTVAPTVSHAKEVKKRGRPAKNGKKTN